MATRSLTRELALLVLGQVPEQKSASVADLALDSILDQALDTLTQHWRESLDASAAELDQAQQSLLDSELQQGEPGTHDTCLLYTSPSPRDYAASRMPSSA